MSDENTPEDVAKKRVLALHQMAQINCKNTGGDPAEAVFELLVAACMIAGLHLKDGGKDLAELMDQIMPAAERCAREWFPDYSRRTAPETLQ